MNKNAHKLISAQLIQDLIGKDAFRGVTLSYSWLANQFGHFALGFIPATAIYVINSDKVTGNRGVYWPSFLVWGCWLAFEVINFFVSIVKANWNAHKKKKEKKIFYKPLRLHFIFDTFIDLCFFGIGATFASLLFANSNTTIMFAVAFSAILIPSSYYWYGTKIYLQRALYPFQFRLSQWTRDMSKENEEAINKFMEARFCGTHLLVLGEDDDEKIHICVGIGTEISYQLKKCRYLTTMKMFECFYRKEAEDSQISHKYCWNWEEAELLIIDDINPSHSAIKEVITADEFFDKIYDNEAERNSRWLREKKVIWMLGNENEGDSEQLAWKEKLFTIGVDPINIIIINLSEKKPVEISKD